VVFVVAAAGPGKRVSFILLLAVVVVVVVVVVVAVAVWTLVLVLSDVWGRLLLSPCCYYLTQLCLCCWRMAADFTPITTFQPRHNPCHRHGHCCN
jgi:hypothetical protein